MIHVQSLTGAFSVLISLKGCFYARCIELSKGQATPSRSQAGTTETGSLPASTFQFSAVPLQESTERCDPPGASIPSNTRGYSSAYPSHSEGQPEDAFFLSLPFLSPPAHPSLQPSSLVVKPQSPSPGTASAPYRNPL